MDSLPNTSAAAVLGRLLWILIGPIGLVLATYSIVSRGESWLTSADVVFFAILFAMMLGRWVEFRRGSPLTATGEPAGPQHLRRYFVGAGAAGICLWAAANLMWSVIL